MSCRAKKTITTSVFFQADNRTKRDKYASVDAANEVIFKMQSNAKTTI